MNSPIPATINHLLANDTQARQKLMAHSGKTVCIEAGVVEVRLTISADGYCETAVSDSVANVTIQLRLADLPLIAQQPERAFSHVKIAGDADLANTISQISQNLRWDAEHDLSRMVGDIAAHRIVTGAKSTLEGAQANSRKLLENIAEYFLEENVMLVRPLAVTEFTGTVTTLRNDLERLNKRIERLE
ncbi:MAG: SCP2 sterol-binding domain-containing protein, partial [Herbaspirillum sp.]